MKHRIVGVMGHVDHGKTALVRALTGTDTDRLPEEKRRGISIALGFAHFAASPDSVIDLIDMPGHERFVRTMVSGATGIDAVLLVVAANEGVKPQSAEHVAIASLLGLDRAIIAISKADLATPAQIAHAAEAASLLVADGGLSAPAPILVSVPNGEGIETLRAALAGVADAPRVRPDRGAAFLPIDRAFTRQGHGTIVTGTLRHGGLAPSDTLEILPQRIPVRIRALHAHGSRVAQAEPGERVAVNLRGIEITAIRRGAALAAPGLSASRWITVRLRAIEALPTGAFLRALLGTEDVQARLRLLGTDTLHAGQAGFAQLHCREPVAIPTREGVILRVPSPARTVAGGPVLDGGATRLRRHDPAVLTRLTLLAGNDVSAIVAHEIAQAGAEGVTIGRLAQLTGLPPAQVATRLPDGAVIARNGTITIGEVMSRAQQNPAREEDIRGAARIAEALRRSGLQPPDPGTLPGQWIAPLLRAGLVVRTRDRVQKRDILFHRDAIIEARRILAPLMAEPPGLTVSEAGAALGVSRKYSVPLLEHLDGIRFTRRVADRRVLAACDDLP